MPNQSYHRGDLKTELIKAGIKLLDQEGYEGFSLRKVAKACNVSQTAPYRHFKDKDALVIAIAIEALQTFNDTLKQALEQHQGNPKKQLIEMGIAYISFFVANPEYLRLIFFNNLQMKTDIYSCDGFDQFQKDNPFQTFFKAVEKYKEATPEQTMSVEELIVYCWGLVHGISILIINKEIPFEGDYLALARDLFEKHNLL